MRMISSVGAAALGVALLTAAPAAAQGVECTQDGCHMRLTGAQLLAKAEGLVSERRFGEAAPMLAALENAPEFDLQRRFLMGFSAVEMGDIDAGIAAFRSILNAHPDQTRVRLELARALMLKGRTGAADYHFRLAQSAGDLPPEIAATIRASRRLLHDSRELAFSLDLGIAPDTNITNGTSAETVDVSFGDQRIPLTLDSEARARSGIGQTASASAAARISIGEESRLLIEADGQAVNYKGGASDDFALQLAVGPEFSLSDSTKLSLQAIGSQRWFGGDVANRAGGMRATIQHMIGDSDRVGLTLDARRNQSGFTSGYDGWQLGGTATYETIVARSMVASASLFARRDALNLAAYSSGEIGANLGIGGELPFGLAAGISGGASRAVYDAPLALFGNDPRKEWRLNGRVQLGLRSLRVLGFSPSVTYSFSQTQSNLTLYDNIRHRIRFGLARYF